MGHRKKAEHSIIERLPRKGNAEKAAAFAERHRLSILMVVLAIILLAALLSFDPKQSTGGDNGTYISLTRSLLDGKGYRDLYTPGEPYHHQYPFGYPLLLAAIGAFSNQSFLLYNLFSVLGLIAGCWVVYGLIRHMFGGLTDRRSVLPIIIVLLTGLNPSHLEFSHLTLTEIPYYFVSLAGLLLVLLSERERGMSYALLCSGVIVSAYSYYIRPNGITLLGAIVFYFIYRRNWKAVIISAVGALILLLPWTIYNQQTGSGMGQSVSIFFTKDVYNLDAGRLGFFDMLERIVENWQIYFGSVLPAMLFPAVRTAMSVLTGGGRIVVAVIFSGILTAGLVSHYRRQGMLVGLYLMGYMLLTLVWHPTVSSDRYLVPVYPLLLFYILAGTAWLAGKINAVFTKVSILLLSVVLLILTVAVILPQMGNNIEMLSAYRKGDHLAGYDPAWRSFFTAAEWIKANTPEGSIVVSRKPSLFYLSAQRKTFCYPFTANRDSVLKEIDRADYVMVEPVSGTGQKYLIPAIQPLLDKRYKIIYAQGDPPTYVLQIIKENPNAR